MRQRTIALCALLCGCQQASDPVEFRSIEPVCIEEEAPAEAWTCSEPLVLDCNDAEVPEEIHVELGEGECAGTDLVPVDGPFPPGEYDIVIVDASRDAEVCATELTVTDALAPVVEGAELSMWPPNHELHDFTLDDCIVAVDDCDPGWTAAIDFIASDAPDEDIGDGNTESDIAITGSDSFTLRSERQGGRNGRVYTVGFTVTDGSGNATPAECYVVVDHDQGNGAAIDDGEDHRVEP
jgi:hypothetical protein